MLGFKARHHANVLYVQATKETAPSGFATSSSPSQDPWPPSHNNRSTLSYGKRTDVERIYGRLVQFRSLACRVTLIGLWPKSKLIIN